jgi:hypothetical protein
MGSIMGSQVDRMLFNMSVTLVNAATVASKQGNTSHAASIMEEGLIVLQSVLPDDHRVVMSVKKVLSRMEGLHGQSINDSFDSNVTPISVEPKEISFRQRLHNICLASKESSQLQKFDVSDDLNLSCAEMLTLGSPTKVEMNIQDRVKIQMNLSRLPYALIAEGNSKRHCSWVDINNTADSKKEKDFNFLDVSQKAAKYVKVSSKLPNSNTWLFSN